MKSLYGRARRQLWSHHEFYAEEQRMSADLEDLLAALETRGDARIPHKAALAIIGGARPVRALREHGELTLRELSERSGVAVSYLSEIERGRKPGSVAALGRIAGALGVTIDALTIDDGETP